MAQARDKFGQDDNYRMAGYLAAHFMKVIRDVYGEGGRSKWRGVLATQTVNADVTNRMIAGAKQYIEEHDHSLNYCRFIQRRRGHWLLRRKSW